MEGKNQAIHEYDKMLWNLRIGYLTVFFAVWALLLKKVIETPEYVYSNELLRLMAILGLFISLGALFVDLNYSWRKYKVIAALNKLYRKITAMASAKDPRLKVFRKLILISGTTILKSKNIKDQKKMIESGFIKELLVCLVIYLGSLGLLYIGLGLMPG